MATTNFIDKSTVIPAEWCNEVDNLVHDIFGNPSTKAGAVNALNPTGTDGTPVTGTAGTSGNLVQWDANGDATDSSVVGANVATKAGSETLTNKTIDGDNNTISNLAHGAEVDNPTSGVHGVTGSVVGTTDSQTLTNKTLTSPVINTSVSGTAILDEDDMTSNSATQLATQQSIKAYVDSQTTGATIKFKLNEEAVVSSTTLQDDDDFDAWSLEANTFYIIRLKIYLDDAGGVGGFKFSFVFSETPAVAVAGAYRLIKDDGTILDYVDSASLGGTISTSLSNDLAYLDLQAYVKSNAFNPSTVKFQWAQATSDAAGTSIRSAGMMEVVKADV